MSAIERSLRKRMSVISAACMVGPSCILAVASPPPTEYVSGRLPVTTPVSTDAALAQIERGHELSDIVSARVGKPPDGGFGDAPWLDVVVRTPSVGDGGDMLGLWETDLLLGSVADLSGHGAVAVENVAGARVSKTLPGGGVVEDNSGRGWVAARQAFAEDTPGQIEERVRSEAEAFGLTVESVRVVHGISAAPIVVLRAARVDALARYPELVTALFGTPPRYEGFYLEITGPDGRPLVRQSAAFRTGAGRTWNDPSVTGLVGIAHAGPVGLRVAAIGASLAGLRWSGGGSLVAHVRLSGPGTVTLTVRGPHGGRVLARGHAVVTGRGTRFVRLRAIEGRTNPFVRRGTRVQLTASLRDTSGRPAGFTYTVRPKP